MIHHKSLFRVALASADVFFGLGLLAFSGVAYGGSPALALLGFLYFIMGSRVLGFLRLKGFLAATGALTVAMSYAAFSSRLPTRDTAPLFAALAAFFIANLLYAFRLQAPRL